MVSCRPDRDDRSRRYELAPATWRQKVDAALRFAAITGLAAPSTTLIPLPLTQLLTRRFHREVLSKKLHFMVEWADASMRWVLGTELRVSGKQNIPKDTRGHMFISNHQSYVDILVLMSALDTVAFLSKSLVRKIPFIGRSAYMGGTVFFSRSSADERQRALEETLRMCRESTAVVVFPEGTRSLDGGLREKIYPRSIKEAHRSGLKVIPVALHGTYKVFPKTMDRVETGLPVSVHIGDAIDPRDHASPDGFVEACWQTVADLHDRARREIEGEGCSAEGDAEVIGRIGKAGSFQRQAGVSRDVA